MKKIILFVISFALALPLTAENVVTEMIDGINYILEGETETNTATVTIAQQTPYKGYIIIPDSVKTVQGMTYKVRFIGEKAFKDCTLDSMVIPQMVEAIKDSAFWGCSVKNISVYNPVPPTVEAHTFGNGTTRATLYVPQLALEEYQLATGWMDFAILPLDSKPHDVKIDTTTVQNKATLTWKAVPSANRYEMHIYTELGSKAFLDTTLYFDDKGELAKSPVRRIAMDDVGSIIVEGIGPFAVSVSTSGSARIDLVYNMKSFNSDSKLIQQEQSSFSLNKKSSYTALSRVVTSSLPEGIYDLSGRCYSLDTMDQLPQGIYLIQKEGHVTKYTRTY